MAPAPRDNDTDNNNAITDPILIMDRIVTATTLASLVQALLGLRETLRSPNRSQFLDEIILRQRQQGDNSDNDDDDVTALWNALVRILQGTHTACRNATQRDEALQAVLLIYRQLTTTTTSTSSSSSSSTSSLLYTTWLSNPAWMPALVDVATTSATEDDTNTNNDSSLPRVARYASYTRVLALQTIVAAVTAAPRPAQQALLAAQQALTRLADLVTHQEGDEQVRLAAWTELAPAVIGTWPAAAKMWVFAEVPQSVLRRCVLEEGGWTDGNPIVRDGIALLQALLCHEATTALLVTQSDPQWWPLLGRLLDLRLGVEYLHPERITARSKKKKTKQQRHATTTQAKDDLDDLLAESTTKSPTKSTTMTQYDVDDNNDEDTQALVPRLLPSEEAILQQVLELLRTLLQHEAIRKAVWDTQRPLFSMTWDWALMGPPPPPASSSSYPCAFSSTALQCQVLDLVADYFNDGSLLLNPQWAGLDRCLYLVCTGGAGTTVTEKYQVSQAAVAVLRQCMTPEIVQEVVLAAMMVTPSSSSSNSEPEQEPVLDPTDALKASALPRLLQTVVEHLQTPQNNNTNDDNDAGMVGFVGSLSALSLFTGTTEAEKALLLKVTTPSLLHDAWERLAVELERQQQQQSRNDSGTSERAVAEQAASRLVIVTILRWVGSWMAGAPHVVQAWLQDAESPAIWAALVHHSDVDDDSTVATVASLVAGVALCHLPADTSDCGGWTKESLVQLLQPLPARMAAWESWKKTAFFHDAAAAVELPWMTHAKEAQTWTAWYTEQVWHVRKALVEHVTGRTSGNPDDDDENNDNHDDKDAAKKHVPSRKSLQTLMAQQAQEMERLQKELQEAQAKVQSQGMYVGGVMGRRPFCIRIVRYGTNNVCDCMCFGACSATHFGGQSTEKQLKVWKKRIESTPTELDEMLSEYGTQTAALEDTIRTLRTDVEERDSKIASLENRVKEVETAENELTEERDRMQEEMQALSDAYGSLEDEYRRLERQRQEEQQAQPSTQQEPTTAAGEDPRGAEGGAGDDGDAANRAAEQAQGENPDQAASVATGSTEVATLRAENARLRETARQADDWMRMAVDRMGAQDAQLAETQQRIQILEGQLREQQRLEGHDMSSMEQWQHVEKELRDALESAQTAQSEAERQLSDLLNEQQIRVEQEQSTRKDLEQALEQARSEVMVLKQEVSLVKSQNDELAKEDSRTLDALKSKGEAAQQAAEAELESARESVIAVQKENELLHNRIRDLESTLASFERASSEPEVQAQVDSFKQQLLESEKSKNLDAGDNSALMEEIEQLRQSNQAAQEWMAQAVEHHNVLVEQNSSLQAEIEKLKNESVKSMGMTEVSNLNVEGSTHFSLEIQRELDEKAERIESLLAEIEQLKSDALITPPVEDSREVELAALRAEIDALQKQKVESDKRLSEAELQYEQMKSELAVLSHEHEDVLEELASLQKNAASTSDTGSKYGEFQQKRTMILGKLN